jgi:hypothetical protein
MCRTANVKIMTVLKASVIYPKLRDVNILSLDGAERNPTPTQTVGLLGHPQFDAHCQGHSSWHVDKIVEMKNSAMVTT